MNRREFLQLGTLGLATLTFPFQAHATKTEQNIPEEIIEAAKTIGVSCTLHSKEDLVIGAGAVLEDLLFTAYHIWNRSLKEGEDGLYIGDARLVCIGNTPKSDIAVFQIPKDADKLHSKYTFKLPRLEVGQKVFAYAPKKGFQVGKIAGRLEEITDKDKTTYENLIPFSAKVIPGYSGGPVFNELGEVIGITTHQTPDTEGNSMGGYFSPLTNARFKRLE